MATTRSAGARLGVEDWTEHALSLLLAEGVGAIKINRLCQELGVTKGSFYWHFSDLDAFMAAVAGRWCAETREALSSLESLHHLPPLDRLRAMALHLLQDRSAAIERALRDWARTDPSVAQVIAEGDTFIFGLVQAALIELGLPAAGARLRAGLLVYAGIGFAHGAPALPQPDAADVDDLMELLAGDVARVR